MNSSEQKKALHFIEKQHAAFQKKIVTLSQMNTSIHPHVNEKRRLLLEWYQVQQRILETQKREILSIFS